MDRMERKKIVVRSERTIKTKLMKDNVNNYRLGETAKEVKVKWENPEDGNAPGGGYEHVAITPESVKENEGKSIENSEPKIDKNDKRDPSQVSFYDDVVKKKKKKKKK